MKKRYLDLSVYEAARQRMAYVMRTFERVYVSFSGGKDSSVMMHLAIEEARKAGRLPLDVLFVDLEAQYSRTIEHVRSMVERPEVRCHWICLPLSTPNAVSVHEPIWTVWDPEKKDKWVRDKPSMPYVVSDPSYFPFYRNAMTFEDFVPAFAEWFGGGALTACLVGIRSDESLNRFRTIMTENKTRHADLAWTTKVGPNVFNAYPIYDWRTEDVWTANARNSWSYNQVYDLMAQAGLSIHQMRICEPYGPDQRKGLWLYHLLEPETWPKVAARVAGANFGAMYAGEKILGNIKVEKPDGHTWESYALFLLETMPPPTAEHYKNKISKYLKWWIDRDYPSGIPDWQPGDTGSGDVPSWRRICKTILRNDYWCRTLYFSQTKPENYNRYKEMMKKKREEWNLL